MSQFLTFFVSKIFKLIIWKKKYEIGKRSGKISTDFWLFDQQSRENQIFFLKNQLKL